MKRSELQRVGEVYVSRCYMRRRAGTYTANWDKDKPPMTREQKQRRFERSFKGETVNGVPVSTYHPSLIYGVYLRTKRGVKLISKHLDFYEAVQASGAAHGTSL